MIELINMNQLNTPYYQYHGVEFSLNNNCFYLTYTVKNLSEPNNEKEIFDLIEIPDCSTECMSLIHYEQKI